MRENSWFAVCVCRSNVLCSICPPSRLDFFDSSASFTDEILVSAFPLNRGVVSHAETSENRQAMFQCAFHLQSPPVGVLRFFPGCVQSSVATRRSSSPRFYCASGHSLQRLGEYGNQHLLRNNYRQLGSSLHPRFPCCLDYHRPCLFSTVEFEAVISPMSLVVF